MSTHVTFGTGRWALMGLLLALMVCGREVGAADVERNWARQGSASQSSTALGGVAARAIDGNRSGVWTAGSVTHTNQEQEPYWQIDLGAAHYVDEIRLYNRTDCCGERLHDLLVFFANSTKPFQHRDIGSTMGENTTTDVNTAVYFKTVFFQAGDIDPVTHKRLARHTFKISGDDCGREGQRGCLMRHVRVQLSGEGTLSLGEVEIVERATIPGPAPAAAATTWTPTPVVADVAGAALAGAGDRLLLFHRGSDNLLHLSRDLETAAPLAGSPEMAPDAPSAVVSRVDGRAYAAVRTAAGQVAVMETEMSDGAPLAPGWTTLGPTSTAPAIAVGCNRVVTAWLDGGTIRSSWRVASGATGVGWSAATDVLAGSRTPPSLAVDSEGNFGLGFLRPDGSIGFTRQRCLDTPGTWTPAETLVGASGGDRANVAAYGNHFLMATIGGDNRGYLATRSEAVGAAPWSGFEPIPASMRGDPGLPLQEAPRLFVMSGAIVALGRARQTQEMLYWVKLPNQIEAGDTWVGGRVVGGAGRGAVTPLVASLGAAHLWGAWGAPAELYVATRGIGDRRIYAMNLGRFIAHDVLVQDLHLTVGGFAHIEPQPERGLDPALATNLFEQMVALLSLPRAARTAVVGQSCGGSALVKAAFLELDRGYGSAQHRGECPARVLAGTERLGVDSLSHEWMHADAAVRDLPSQPAFAAAFPFARTGLVPSESGMRACRSANDCGGDACERAGDNRQDTAASTRDFDPAETELRRWDDVFVCVADGGPDGRRYQGGLRWYDVGTTDHAFIHMAIAYRWYGDDLRDWVAADLARGNDQLQRRYEWVRNYFGGVEYNGRANSGASPPGSDRSLGAFGQPSR